MSQCRRAPGAARFSFVGDGPLAERGSGHECSSMGPPRGPGEGDRAEDAPASLLLSVDAPVSHGSSPRPMSAIAPIAEAPAEAPQKHPSGFWFIFWGELAERASFYGMRTVLALYMTAACCASRRSNGGGHHARGSWRPVT